MRFMTAASVRNLPAYEREDRQNRMLQQETKEKETAENERKLLVQFGLELQNISDSAKSQEELNNGFSVIKKKYSSMGMTPEMMQMGANLTRQFKQDMLADQDRQMKMEDRNRLLRKDSIAESDTDLLGQLVTGNIKPMGGNEFMVPASEKDASQGLSGAGQLRLIDIKNAQEDRGTAKEDRLLRNKLTNAQILKAGKEDKRTQLVQKEDGSYSLIDLDTGKTIDTGVTGKTNQDFAQAKAKIEILDKKRNSILKKYDDDISDPETVLMEKAGSGDVIAKKDLADYQRYSQESDNLTQKMIGGGEKEPEAAEQKNEGQSKLQDYLKRLQSNGVTKPVKYQ